jgi:hypothetical protein
MINVRRWYVYLASAILLNSVAWAAIVLFRNLFIRSLEASDTDLALQISLIIVGVPLYLVHWTWAQRLANRDEEERASFPRRLFLYGMLAAFLSPFLLNAYWLVNALEHLIFDIRIDNYYQDPTLRELPAYNLIALFILALSWGYHWWVKVNDDRAITESDACSVIRQIYHYAFCAAGLLLTTLATVDILHWLLLAIAPQVKARIGIGTSYLLSQLALLIVGLPLWLVFWRGAQNRFYRPDEVEQSSIVRKVYLYLAVFLSIIAVVTTLAIVFSDWLGALLGLPPGDGDFRLAISVVVVVGAAWAYHANVLKGDADLAVEAGQGTLVRRIYLYLMAGVGLTAVLTGLGGVLSVFIRALAGRGLILDLREQLSYFTAALFAGLPVWILNWRQVQIAASKEGAVWQEERSSFVRSFYLYIFIFAATMTALGSAVYIVSQVVELALGARSAQGLIVDIGQALAYTVIAALVWVYHGAILRQDRRLLHEEQAKRMKALRVVVADVGDGSLGLAIVQVLAQKVAGAQVTAFGLSPTAAETLTSSEESLEELLSNADLIVGPWSMVSAGTIVEDESAIHAQEIASSPAKKLLIPVEAQGWDWVGVERLKQEAIVDEVVEAVKLMASGESGRAGRRLSVGAVVGIVIAVLISLCVFSQIMAIIFEQF